MVIFVSLVAIALCDLSGGESETAGNADLRLGKRGSAARSSTSCALWIGCQEREKLVAALHYEELTLREIGEVLG
jgi:hypothetical protein